MYELTQAFPGPSFAQCFKLKCLCSCPWYKVGTRWERVTHWLALQGRCSAGWAGCSSVLSALPTPHLQANWRTFPCSCPGEGKKPERICQKLTSFSYSSFTFGVRGAEWGKAGKPLGVKARKHLPPQGICMGQGLQNGNQKQQRAPYREWILLFAKKQPKYCKSHITWIKAFLHLKHVALSASIFNIFISFFFLL